MPNETGERFIAKDFYPLERQLALSGGPQKIGVINIFFSFDKVRLKINSLNCSHKYSKKN